MATDFQTLVNRHYQADSWDTVGTVRLFFQPVDHFYHQNLEALAILTDYLANQSRLPVCRMLRNREGQLGTEINGSLCVLMTLPQASNQKDRPLGKALAELHLLTTGVDGQSFPEGTVYQRTEGLTASVDQLGTKYNEIGSRSPKNSFERRFRQTFPYFSGCAENAIQYMVDGSLKYPRSESLAISHYRFAGFSSLYPENPATWVASERSRDLAEWLRLLAWTREKEEMLFSANQFLNEYEELYPLSEQAAASMFGRLLFPLSYVECCERYLAGESAQDHALLEDVLLTNENRTENTQQLLSYLGVRYPELEIPEWLLGARAEAF
ncbi:MAG: spore coat protein YutH [Sporolactobacillus sp.]